MYQAALDRLAREFAAVEKITEEVATQAAAGPRPGGLSPPLVAQASGGRRTPFLHSAVTDQAARLPRPAWTGAHWGVGPSTSGSTAPLTAARVGLWLPLA